MKIHTLLLSTTLLISVTMVACTSTDTKNSETTNTKKTSLKTTESETKNSAEISIETTNIEKPKTDTTSLDAKQEGIKYIKMLGGALKKELKAQLMADKTGLSAAGFCASEATKITKNINAKLPAYAKVRRTALKLRNDTENKADDLDKSMMEIYEDLIKNKKLLPEKEIVTVKDGNTTRVYKPLITTAACLKCHGDNVSPEIKKVIKSKYPNDKAMHFKEGDLRGVIVAEITKH